MRVAPNFKNRTGERFGRLLVIELAFRHSIVNGKRKNTHWICLCDCGKTVTVATTGLTNKTRSCGCLHKEQLVARSTKHGHCRRNHVSSEYNSWSSLLERCNNPRCSEYRNYGGRGITVCQRWLNSYSNFFEDMGPKPGPEYSIDRIDVNGNYEPSNCRWATTKEQNENKRWPNGYGEKTWNDFLERNS